MVAPRDDSTPLHSWLTECEAALPLDMREILEKERLERSDVRLQHGLGLKLTAILIEATRRIGPVHFANAVRFWLGLPFSTPKNCDYAERTAITDPRLSNHLLRCGTGKHRINTHNELRDACISMAQHAGFIVHSKSAVFCPIEEQTADFTMMDRSSGAVYVCDITVTDPISTRDREAEKGRGWAAREQADKKIKHYANRPEIVGFFPLAVDTYGCPCAEVPVFLKLLADTAARRHFNANSKSFYATKFLHLFRQRWSVALQRAQSVGLLLKLGEAAAAENPPVGGIGPEHRGRGGHLHLGAGSGGAEPGGAEPGGAGLPVLDLAVLRVLPSPQELREWFAHRWSRAAGAGGAASAGGSAATGGARAGGATGAGPGGSTSTGGAGATSPGGARTGGTGAAGPAGAPSAGAGGAARVGATGGTGAGVAVSAGGPAGAGAAGCTGAGGAAGVGADAGGAGVVPAGSGGAARPRPYFVPLLEQVPGLPPSSGPAPPLECPPPVQSESQLQLASPLPAPSPYAGPTGGVAERREPESRPSSPVRTARTSRPVPRPLPPAVPGTHQMTLRPSTAPQRVPLPSPPASSLPALADPASDSLRAASPTVTRLLATVVTDPSFESTAASALVTELVDFADHCHLDFATSLVAESASVCPPSVGGECALSTDVLEDRQEEFQCFAAALPHLVSTLLAPGGDPDAPDIRTPRSYVEAIEGPYSSQWQAAMDAEMASWKSTGTYVDDVPPPGANIVSGMWIFRVKRPPGSPPVFKARYVARDFSQRQGVDFFQTFSPTPKMTTLRVLLHVAAQRDYELHSLDFSTAFLQGILHDEIWLRRPPGFTGSFPPGTQWSLRWPIYGLRQAPRDWHDTLRTTLVALGFAPSTADPSLFLRTNTLLPPFYIVVYVDDLVFATADTAGLAHVKSELQKRHTCTDLGELRSYLGLQITRDRARHTITLTQSHMVQQVLQRFDFTYSSPQATPLSTRHSLSALPSDESVEPSGPYPKLVGCLMYVMTCTRPDLAYPLSILARYVAPGRHRPENMAAAKRVLRYLCSTSGLGLVLGGRSPVVLTGHADASWVDDLAMQWSSQGYTFSLGSGSVSWRSTRSSFVLSSSCEAEIYAGAMAAQELRWLTYLLTDLGEPPCSPPVLYVDNKAMLALCREHRLEHRTKHIALRYFLARELQQRGQLRLAYVASQANTADIFTKALQPCDHQRFCTMLGLVPTLLHWLTS
ncbi:unnamed protein product [Closterium sp. NIES-54]